MMRLSLHVALLALCVAMPVSAESRRTLAFVNVNVIPMTGVGLLEKHTVIIDAGQVVAIGPGDSVNVPETAYIIEGEGRFLMPGLSDMHAHVAPLMADGRQADHADMLLYLATGVTTVRNTAGFDGHLPLRSALESGQIVGPRFYTTSPVLEGENAVWDFSTKVTTAPAAKRAVAEAAEQGYDEIKVYHTLAPAVYDAVIEEAELHDIPVIGHVPFGLGVEHSLSVGQYSIEHFRGYDIDGLAPEILALNGGRNAARFAALLNMSDQRMDELVAATVAAGTWNCPTLVVNSYLANAGFLEQLLEDPRSEYLPAAIRQRYSSSALLKLFSPESRAMLALVEPRMQTLIGKLHFSGAGLLIGTDTFPSLIPGFTVIDEMQKFEGAGLTPSEVLKIATADAATYLNDPAISGTIVQGAGTDMILLSANPMEDLANLWALEGVLVRGQWMEKQFLLETLAQIVESEE
ncbi:MAG: amidohydrolase family protein [Pseudomonadota bacterium]